MKRSFLMLADKYDPNKYRPGGFYVSEKLDGMRCFWDGGITRGKKLEDVPWANTAKDARYVTRPVGTGLWTRYGKSIQAPDWWVDKLPTNVFLDGELYIQRNSFQTLVSITKTLIPGPGWGSVKFLVFDSPPAHTVFCNGTLNETNFKKDFVDIANKVNLTGIKAPTSLVFRDVHSWLMDTVEQNDTITIHEQEELSYNDTLAKQRIDEKLGEVCTLGGEGLMLRSPSSYWTPSRSKNLLKVKNLQDAEGVVRGYIWGRETDLGSKLLGLMGAMIIEYRGKTFELSGFTDDERRLSHAEDGIQQPGTMAGPHVTSQLFPRGSKVTFRYRELTDDGIPKEARYWRKPHI